MFSRKKQPLIKSLIAKGTCVQGDILFTDGLRIDGEVHGDVRADVEPSIVVISESAQVQGRVQAAHVIVNGTVLGPVHAGELLELQPRARVTGDVHYKALEMHQGALISGQMRPSEVVLPEAPQLKLASSGG
ncbi:polymer-forming cytoskeletal protein [Comamonas sp. NLF-1-9]|uniref:bactofilin family protein n=1 Tax=Comamonas sp. NLF-1-9 TaxID=2853163 RepID=UPI001C471325|nr:polymer-forming cytoskeletal protein [Comamonas sp. NLF-1-9]QXL83394.1 polymer-forming cytoskeletal protein [Comamonas sp. NLF-1-9]